VEVLPDIIITIPEGFTIKDIAAYLEENEIMEAAEFITACESYDRNLFSFLSGLPHRPNSLEGYLFPDTYYISAHPSAEEIINKMLTRFDEVFDDELRARAEELGLSIDDAVIMASIIEGEVRVAAERPIVSQVIYNRIDRGMKLEMDCTVQYALDKRQERLLYSDLEIDSPYNTYLNPGLPIGPIANPGANCLRAAMFPEEGDFLYYVLQNEETGEHYFTDDYNDFLSAAAAR
jgi:UPF0755 protein